MCNKQGEGEKGGGGKREDEKKLPPPRFPQKIAPRDLSSPQLTLVCVHTRGGRWEGRRGGTRFLFAASEEEEEEENFSRVTKQKTRKGGIQGGRSLFDPISRKR